MIDQLARPFKLGFIFGQLFQQFTHMECIANRLDHTPVYKTGYIIEVGNRFPQFTVELLQGLQESDIQPF